MNKKYNPRVLETIARKAWLSLHYEDAVEMSLLERKISFLFEAEVEPAKAVSEKDIENVDEQSQEALNDLEKAVQRADDIFGPGSNTTAYLMTLRDETPPQPLLFPPDTDPKDAAKKIAQKAGTTAQIQTVVSSMDAALSYFGKESSKLPIDQMNAEIQKIDDDAKIETTAGVASGKDIKEKWKSLPIGVIADVAGALQALPDSDIDWSKMPNREKITTAAASSFTMPEPTGIMGNILNFFNLGGYDKSHFAEDILKVSIANLQEKLPDVPPPDTGPSQEAATTVDALEDELAALSKGDEDALPTASAPGPDEGEPGEGEPGEPGEPGETPEGEPEAPEGGKYKITPQDIRGIKSAMTSAQGKKKSQSKALGGYLNQAVGEDVFEESFVYDENQYSVEDLTYYQLMRMAGLSED